MDYIELKNKRDSLKAMKYHNRMILKKLIKEISNSIVDFDITKIEDDEYFEKFIEEAEAGNIKPVGEDGISVIRLITEPDYITSLIERVRADKNEIEAEILSKLNTVEYGL